MSFPYTPSTFPDPKDDPDGFMAKVKDEFDHIMKAVNGESNSIQLREFHKEPDKKVNGMLVLADGADWDPGEGGGVYCWDVVPPDTDPDWHFLGSSSIVLPSTRELLSADRNYYVSNVGSDSADGLTSLTPIKTLAHAVALVYALDLNDKNVVINLVDGTFDETVRIDKAFVGNGSVTIKGNATTPANVVVGDQTAYGVIVSGGGIVTLRDFKIRSGSSGHSLVVLEGGLVYFTNLDFAATTNSQILVKNNGYCAAIGNYKISGSAANHIYAYIGAIVNISGITVTLSGTPAFSASYASVLFGATVYLNSNTYSGSATGSDYNVGSGGTLYLGGGSLPGNAAGTVDGGFVDNVYYSANDAVIEYTNEAPANQTYDIELSAPYGYTITAVKARCRAGTCTATVKIGTTALGGGANSVTTTLSSVSHSSANVVAAAGKVSVTVSSVSSCAGLRLTIYASRTAP